MPPPPPAESDVVMELAYDVCELNLNGNPMASIEFAAKWEIGEQVGGGGMSRLCLWKTWI